MDDIRTIRQQLPGVTVNDVFMSVVGGALRRYLAAKNELPATSMLAAVPMSLRGTDKTGEGNQVGFTLMSVHSDLADPIERLEAAKQSGAAAKRSTDAIGKDFLMNLFEAMPAPVSELLLRNAKMPKLSLVVSNVRGPDVTLYMAGARMVAHLPISIVLDGVTLNCTGFSYAGTLWVCALACREVLPDPAFFAECLRGSFEDLKRAAAERVAREALAARDEPIRRAGAIKPARRVGAARAVVRKRRVNGASARRLT